MSEIEARTWGQQLELGNALFKDVPVGGYFKFRSDITYGRGPNRKTSERYYRTAEGRVFKTGPFVSVYVQSEVGK